jgi:glyoxylase-like metal-dependent hydrolase (beta-lactamase superfamily II)
MANVRLDIISIGTLSRNRLWNETEARRTPHATTSLIRTGKRNILVDPGLPAPALAARLYERTGIGPNQIDTVFLTNFRPAHRAGLGLFENARVLIHEVEKQSTLAAMERMLEQGEPEDRENLAAELEILNGLEAAEDELAPEVDLFPLFGYTPGKFMRSPI